ncbi:MAG: hypothetical protein AAB131_23465 [Actinomycetota bacterium]|nr:MAG: hypothetical protein FD127_2672 [Acidimicrobiaceae bacterium]
MDLSKFKTSDWMKVGGGGLMLVAYFLKWWKVDTDFGDVGFKGSNYFFTGTVPWLLLLAVGVLTFLGAAGVFKLPGSVPAPLVFLAASALSLLLVLVRFFSDGVDTGGVDSGLTRGIGLFLALAAAVVVLVGSVLGFKESGGDLNDLKDMNKLKSSFGGGTDGGGSTPPPPPPPGMTPPPPPPPAG